MRKILLLSVMALLASPAVAQQTSTVQYTVDGQTHVGYLALPEEVDDTAPGVLVIPEWWGLDDFARQKAEQLAQMGYVAFAADMYGSGQTTTDPKQAGEWAGPLRQDRERWRTITRAAYDVLREHDASADDRLAVIGFCFGGGTAVELAYTNPPGLEAAVSFHGGPLKPRSADPGPEAAILILHGAEDPLDTPAAITDLTDALSKLGATWQLHLFSGAEHSFMNPGADEHNIDGVSYNERVATRAWDQMQLFFTHTLRSGS